MKKVTGPRKISGKKGWWVRWYENGKPKHKSFPTKSLAEHFQHIQYHRLNSDIFTSPLNVKWDDLVNEFLQQYDLKGRKKSTKDIAKLALNRFKNTAHIASSEQITQTLVDKYLIELIQKKELSNSTLNRDIQRLKSFFAWMKKRKYTFYEIEVNKLPAPPKKVTALTDCQIRALLAACPSLAWKVRILLSLCTGLRKNDIDNAMSSDLDLAGMRLRYVADKTGKHGTAPLPKALRPILERYMDSIGNGRIFNDKHVRGQWDNIRIKAGLYRLKEGHDRPSKNKKNILYLVDRQDFRRTFSTLIQKTSGLSSAKELLQHSSENVTLDYYTDKELLLAWRVNQLPIDKWLDGIEL